MWSTAPAWCIRTRFCRATITAYNLMAATMECGETVDLQQPARVLQGCVEMQPVIDCASALTDVRPVRGPPSC